MASAWDWGAALSGENQEEFVRKLETSLEVKPLDASSRFMMNWGDVRALKQAGHTIGGHTLTHPNLAHVTPREAQTEMLGCKQILESKLRDSVPHFSYPHPALNPQWSPQTLQITREAGFRSAVLTTQGSVQIGDDPLLLMRIPAEADTGIWLWKLERTFLRNHS